MKMGYINFFLSLFLLSLFISNAVMFKQKSFYLGTFSKLNWITAAQYCRYHNMRLATIGSSLENDQLRTFIENSGIIDQGFWVSGTDLGKEGEFVWLSNGQPFTFTDWLPGQPNNNRDKKNGQAPENCVEVTNYYNYGFKWNDQHCHRKQYFICEIEYLAIEESSGSASFSGPKG